MDEEQVIRNRIAVDERAFKRICKRCTEQPEGDDAAREREQVRRDFDAFALTLVRTQLVWNALRTETERYRAQRAAVLSSRAEAQATITRLRAQLARAQLEKQQKLAYDELAMQIRDSGLPPRAAQQGEIEQLEGEMEQLRREREGQRASWMAKREALERVVGELRRVRLWIADEKKQIEGDGVREGEEGEEGDRAITRGPSPTSTHVESTLEERDDKIKGAEGAEDAEDAVDAEKMDTT